MGWIFIGIGAFSILGAAMDWDWFLTHRKAKFFVRVFGRGGARVFYAVLGVALATIGVLFLTGTIPTK